MPDPLPLDPQADDQQLLAQVIDHYHRTLTETADARNYLIRRGITNTEAIDHFRIRFVDYSLATLLPHYYQNAGKAIRARLQGLGIMRSSSHQHFKGCIVFPIMAADGSGRVVDIYGRRLSQGLKPGSPRHRHLSEVRQGVWNVDALAGNEEVILCPSLFDALTFWNAGYRNVTCTFGPDALTDDHLTAFAKFGVRRALLMADAIAPRLLEAGIECHYLSFPPGVDANKYALKTQERAQSLRAIIAKAVRLGDDGQSVVVAESEPPIVVVKEARQPTPKPPPPQPAASCLPLCVDDDQKLLAQVIDYYCCTLKESTEGLNYLRSRGVTVGEAIDRFRIGYANRTLGLKLPVKQLKAGKRIRTHLQQLGLMRGSGHEHFAGCVTFPITTPDGSGRIVDIYGRKTGTHLRKGTPLDMYLSEQRRGVWNVEGLAVSDQVILCSSLFDALTFWNAGYRYVTCTLGPMP